MAIIYLTFNQNARLFSWLQKNSNLCIQVTGEDPLRALNKPIANRDLGPLPYTHADFTDKVQWFLDKHCPYPFVKSGEGKRNHILSIRYWYYKRKKFMK